MSTLWYNLNILQIWYIKRCSKEHCRNSWKQHLQFCTVNCVSAHNYIKKHRPSRWQYLISKVSNVYHECYMNYTNIRLPQSLLSSYHYLQNVVWNFQLLYSDNWHHAIIQAAFVCFLSPQRSFGRSLPNLVGVCRRTSHLPLRGSFSKRSRGWRVNGSLLLSTILCMCQPHSTRCNGAFCFAVVKQQSLILRLFL